MKKYKRDIVVDYCIRGDEFNPHELLDGLNIPNTRSWKKGDKYVGRERDLKQNKIVERESVRPWGIWGIDAKNQRNLKTVEEHIIFILGKIEPHKKLIKEILENNSEYSARLSIFFEFDKDEEDVGFYEIRSNVLKRISDICQYIEFKCTTFEKE